MYLKSMRNSRGKDMGEGNAIFSYKMNTPKKGISPVNAYMYFS